MRLSARHKADRPPDPHLRRLNSSCSSLPASATTESWKPAHRHVSCLLCRFGFSKRGSIIKNSNADCNNATGIMEGASVLGHPKVRSAVVAVSSKHSELCALTLHTSWVLSIHSLRRLRVRGMRSNGQPQMQSLSGPIRHLVSSLAVLHQEGTSLLLSRIQH
jgi:hypothetical protein